MLKTRIFTAIVLLACFIPALFYLPVLPWAALTLILSLLSLYEWANFAQLSKQTTWIYMAVSLLLGMLVMYSMTQVGLHGVFYLSIKVFMLAALFWVLLVPVWLMQSWQLNNKWLMMLLGWFLLGTLWLALIAAQWLNPWMLLIILSIVWLADTAAYFTGKTFGKHKLAPAISPGKTWEGVAGALLANAVFAGVLLFTGIAEHWVVIPIFCLIAVVGIYGDLFESYFKRQANLKDSGRLLPGHGGWLDRIDGIIPALPIAVLMLYGYHYLQSINY